MRCPDCSKFVSYADEPEVEIDSEDVSGDEYTVSFSVKLVCGECSTELKQADLEGAHTLDHDCRVVDEDEYPDVTIESSEIEYTERYQDKDRHGKPITRSRYQKHYYGAKVTATLECQKCSEQFEVTVEDDLPASSFEEVA